MTIQSETEDKQILEKIVAASEEFLQSAGSGLNYQKITDDILDISGAKYAGFNLFDEDGSKFRTLAFSAPKGIIKKVSSLLGFKLIGKSWDYDPIRASKIKSFTITHFSNLGELVGDLIPKPLISLLEKTFNTGEVVLVKILKENVMIGDFTLIMPGNVKFKNDNYVELYTRQVGLLITRSRSEVKLRESEIQLKSILSAISDPLFMIDQKTGAILNVSTAACSLYGYSRDEMLALKATDMSAEPKETRKAMDGPRNLIPVRYHKKKDGTVFIVEITASSFELNGRSVLATSMRDITERKKAEKAIHESEEKYRSLFHQASDGIFYLSIDRKLSAVNKAFAKMHGYSQEEMLEMPLQNLDTPETARLTPERIRRVLAGEVIEFEVEHYHKDGHTFPLAVSAGLISVEGDSMIAAFHQDITERKKVEEEKGNIAERLSLACSAGGIGIWELDILNNNLVWDKQMFDLYGITTDKFNGSYEAWRAGVHPDDLQASEEELQMAIRGEKEFDTVFRVVWPDDTIHTIRALAKVQKDASGKAVKLIGTNYDITESKKAHDALQQSEKRHRLLIENSHDIIYTLDLSGTLTFVSPAWTLLLGHPVSEVTGKSFMLFVHPDDIAGYMAFLQKIIETKQSKTGIEYRVQHIDGYWRWYVSNAMPLFDETGKVIGLEGSATDITQRKQTEKEILYLSYHDKLTGLYNRRFYEAELNRLDTKRNLPLTLVIADVNGLKMANDAFGHLTGDRLLVKVAAAIKKESRTDDIVARIGGDEFILLLPKTPLKDAEKIIARINEKFSRYKLGNVVVSASFGFASKLKETEDMAKVFKKAEDSMYRLKLSESFSTRSRIISVIIKTLYEKNENEQEHSEMVGQFCESLGSGCGLSIAETLRLKTAGLMHDIGKINIDEKILNKPGKLSNSEWITIKRHPETGYRILSSTNEFSQIAKYILAHHERWDGQGYPKGLKGSEIPLEARIIAIADAYSAMIGYRPYKEALSEEDAVKEIKLNAGTQFDPDISRIFVEKVLGKSWEPQALSAAVLPPAGRFG